MTSSVKVDGGIIHESKEDFHEFFENKNFVHFVAFAVRPGVHECLNLLEVRDYPPNTERNDLYHLRIIHWADMHWIIASIPIEEKHLMEQAAEECDLRLANSVPVTITRDGREFFPVNNDRVYTIENKSGHPVYRNDPQVEQALREAEKESVRRTRKKFLG